MFDLSKITEAFESVRTVMNPVIGPREYDEVAVMVRNPMDASWLCREFEKSGFGQKFNKSVDTVTTWPIATEYDVTYRFLEVNREPFRIEVMNFTRGQSPAHIPALLRLGLGLDAVIVHVSYKPPAEALGVEIAAIDSYEAEREILKHRGLEHVQECRSNYGIFSYWIHPDLPKGVYLKPRVNLRDSVDPLKKITEEQFVPASERVETNTLSLEISDRWYPR